jgi:tetratricopeptide (TPR) repeat protein
MRRSLITLVVAVAVAAPVQANLLDVWNEVQSNLAAGDLEGADRAAQVLEERATELEVRRMTPFAAALVQWAESHPDADGEAALGLAQRLDPDYPSIYFADARLEWQRGAYGSAVKDHLVGWIKLLGFEPKGRLLAAVATLWVVSSLALTFLAMIVVMTLRHLRMLAFDARELGGKLFRPANAWVFGIVLLLLPLFAGLGPMWVGVYLFALSWIYFSQASRIWALVACLGLASFMPVLAMVQHHDLRLAQVDERLGTMLDERQLDFSTLREMAHLTDELDGVAMYHLIYGELLRMHGEPDRAKLEFQKATLADPSLSHALIFVGNLALEEGNTKRSVQFYNRALELNSRNAYAYHNLSLAFDLSRRFQEGAEARARAREISGRDSAENGLRGQDARIRYPWLRSGDVQRLMESLDDDQRLSVGVHRFSLEVLEELGSSLSMVFLVGAVLGLVVLALRLRGMPPARECSKCGKLYHLAKGFGESSVYCSQCVSVFQKRDVVSIEQQTTKLDQIRHWETWTTLARRIAGFVLPGSSSMVDGRMARGLGTGFLAWFFLTAALVWVPLFLPQIEPLASHRYQQPALFTLFGLVVLKSGVAAWNRR